jgi:hypothetical protein
MYKLELRRPERTPGVIIHDPWAAPETAEEGDDYFTERLDWQGRLTALATGRSSKEALIDSGALHDACSAHSEQTS